MTKPTYYITTPIYYPSDNLHIGHAYCTTIADTLARYHRLKGEDVWFLTGSDEHGLKIQRKAKEKGVTPIQYVDAIIANFKLLWERLHISNNDFLRTSQERHHKVVQDKQQKIYEQGDIYAKSSDIKPAKYIQIQATTIAINKQHSHSYKANYRPNHPQKCEKSLR